ncbi:DUF6088 family protein [Paenibacillus sp. WLX1005]|uniref:DUF6088 family protein n=1 Tax=unclassified Paenibacillus TaxID=185978 RepID=UPI003983E705
MNSLKEQLLDRYGYNEPIIINQMRNEYFGLKKDSLRRNLNRLVQKGEVERFSEGVYYFPKWNKLLNRKSLISEQAVIEKKYIRNDTDVYGYVSGLAFANQLKLTTQVPALLEIVTEHNASKKRMVTLKNYTLILRKPKVPVTSQNVKWLQVLDLLSGSSAYIETDLTYTREQIKRYLTSTTPCVGDYEWILSQYSRKTRERLKELGIDDAVI